MSDVFPLKGRKILVAGHRGMVGAAVVRRLAREDCLILTLGRDKADLTRQAETEAALAELKPDAIVMAARSADFVVACHHDHYWEPDWHRTPDWKRAFACACIEAGAHCYVSHGVPLLHGGLIDNMWEIGERQHLVPDEPDF